MADDTLSNLTQDAKLAEQRFVRGEIDLGALAPYDRALIDHVERLPSWDRSAGTGEAASLIARARSREQDRTSRPAQYRKSYIPGAPDYESPFQRRRSR